jgi:hypothetical protein
VAGYFEQGFKLCSKELSSCSERLLRFAIAHTALRNSRLQTAQTGSHVFSVCIASCSALPVNYLTFFPPLAAQLHILTDTSLRLQASIFAVQIKS